MKLLQRCEIPGPALEWPGVSQGECAPMPELPEVETMVRGLRPALSGRTLRAVTVHDPFLLQGCNADELTRRLAGAGVDRVDRRGKWVVIALAGHRGLIVIQPRMTGGFWLVPPPRPD